MPRPKPLLLSARWKDPESKFELSLSVVRRRQLLHFLVNFESVCCSSSSSFSDFLVFQVRVFETQGPDLVSHFCLFNYLFSFSSWFCF